MRLASFLPMLLLAFSIPAAAQNCHIFDLTATVVQVNPLACQFFVSLNFQHDNNSNQFSVHGNGTNYGTFEYGQVPLLLGPFNANPNNPTNLEFVVRDVIFQDCFDEISISVPACNLPGGNCEIFNLEVLPGQCDPTGLTYKLRVDFDVQGSASNSFDLWAGGNIFLGTFPIAALPLDIPAFPASGNLVDQLRVCMHDVLNCCAEIEFAAPTCVPSNCGIVDFSVQTGLCTSDSTYKATINFGVIVPNVADSFSLSANGVLIGNFGINQLPLTHEIEWNGGPNDVIKVCLANTAAICCATKEYPVPNCLHFSPCGIHDLTVKPDTCTSDSTFHAILNFVVNDPTAVDSFDLWANGEYLGHFGLNQLPLNIADFPWNGLIFNHVKVCTGSLPGCCREYQFLAPACLPFKPCEITDIFLQTGDCTSDSTYKVRINFNATNPGDGTFLLYVHNQLVDTFDLTQVPLTVELPWNGQPSDFITICIGGNPPTPTPNNCCRIKQFLVPGCILPCDIHDVVLDPGDCHPDDNTFTLHLNFQVNNPGNDLFEVWGNGVYLGAFPLGALPLAIPNFPSNGNATDVIKICINDHPDCCETLEFQGPNCDAPCHIYDVVLDPGDCDPATNGFFLHLDFQVDNPGNSLFEVWGNGTYLGIFPLAGLPMVIPNFPSNGTATDVIKICINDHPDCCETLEFQGPDCNNLPCEIFDLTVVTGDCHPADSTYTIKVDFQVQNPGANTFGVWANGQFFGTYNLSQLPLTIPNFPWDGNGPNDVIKVCITGTNGILSCCRTLEFPTPNCFPGGACDVYDLSVDTGDCTGDSTYQVAINFEVVNAPGDNFSLWANGVFFGIFNVNQLPLHIQDFPWNGGNHDVIRVCFTNSVGGQGACCAEIEYNVPDCLQGGNCEIYDLTVTPGNCDPNAPTYPLTFNFQVQNPGNANFHVMVNGVNFGSHPLSSLPYTIPNVPSNGNASDVIVVCINDQPNCCRTLEFPGPTCNGGGNDCDIFDLVVDPGDCVPGSLGYQLHLNFQVTNPGNDFFEVWGNNVYLGIFPLSALPLLLPNVPSNGAAIDVIKVCINDHPNCCQSIEFQGPNCGGGNNCEIFNLVLDPGNCESDSTYNLHVNFQFVNPTSNLFGVWANSGQFLGNFNVSQLPLTLLFPWDGGATDRIKICFVPNNPVGTPCCVEAEFQVPDCLGGGGDCHIYDLVVVRTPCLCGQFFVALTFQHDNGGAGGFNIVGNGNNYGNYPYDTLQPIILGPFPGDGTTMYEFGVVDHDNPDCHDGYNLGKVECASQVNDPGSASALVLSPNPTANWLSVTALLENGKAVGQADVDIYAADGRLAQSLTVANGANFQLDVSALPAGMYRLVLRSDAGRLEGTFAKQ